QPQQQREEDVELLFDTQRPHVQQRLLFGQRREVVGVAPGVDVGDEAERGEQRLAEAHEIRRQHDQQGDGRAERQQHQQRGHDATHAPFVEAAHREPAGEDLAMDDLRDQVARQHEEDVDAEKAARQVVVREMEQHHRQDRDGAQPVDVRAISGTPAQEIALSAATSSSTRSNTSMKRLYRGTGAMRMMSGSRQSHTTPWSASASKMRRPRRGPPLTRRLSWQPRSFTASGVMTRMSWAHRSRSS